MYYWLKNEIAQLMIIRFFMTTSEIHFKFSHEGILAHFYRYLFFLIDL